MKAKHFPKIRAVGPRGFSKWIQPNMAKYFLECCDCGLVHEFQFRATPKSKRVEFRARRANGYTRSRRAARKCK